MLLALDGLEARCFITVGKVGRVNEAFNAMSGDLFYKNKDLETEVKKAKVKLSNGVYYDGLEKTLELSLLFETLSKLVLGKVKNLPAIYSYEYLNLTQTEIAQKQGLSQSTVNNQLNRSNNNLISRYNIVISKLIKEELGKVKI